MKDDLNSTYIKVVSINTLAEEYGSFKIFIENKTNSCQRDQLQYGA